MTFRSFASTATHFTDANSCGAVGRQYLVSLGDDILDDMGFFHASQFLIQPLEGKDEFLMVNTEEVKHGGMKIPDVYWVLDHVIAEIVGLAVVHATLDSSAC